MLRPAAADPNCDSLPSASTLRPPSRASSGPSPSPPQLSGECDSAGSNPPRPPPCLSVDNWSQSGSGLEVAQAWIHQTSFSKFRRQNTINLKTGEVLSRTTARVASPHAQDSPDTKIDVSDLRPPKTSCDKQGHDKESDEHQRTLSPAGSGPLLLLLDLSCAPNYFGMEMPSYLHGKLAVSTYSTRIRELNKVLCENQSCLVDYTPVKRLASLFFLGIWIITASSLMILWATSAPTLFSWSLFNSLAVIFGVLVGVVAIVAVRFTFSRQPLEYLDDLRLLLQRYTLIDSHHGLVWQLHVSTRYQIPFQNRASSVLKHEFIESLHETGVVAQEDEIPFPIIQAYPLRPLVWISIEFQEFELVMHRGSFVLRPSKYAATADSLTGTVRHELERSVSLSLEPEMDFVREWANQVVDIVVPGSDVRPKSVHCESVLEIDDTTDALDDMHAIDSDFDDQDIS